MVCKKCGTENTEENQFCSKCGRKLAERKKMDSKKKKIIIIIISILLLIIIGISIFLFIENKNKKVYQNATNKFISLNFKDAYSEFEKIESYKNSKAMKETCISQAEETSKSMIESKNYEKAIELYLFIGEHKDIAEDIKKLKEEYIKYLLSEDEYEQAYNYLPNCPEISDKISKEVKLNYISDLMYKNQSQKGFELMNSLENLSDSDKNSILTDYIKSSAYDKAYNILYNSMRNPSSLRINSFSYTIYNEDKKGKYKSSGFDKKTGDFKIHVKFSYSGQNGFGGMSSGYKTYVYKGNINLKTYDLSLDYYLSL